MQTTAARSTPPSRGKTHAAEIVRGLRAAASIAGGRAISAGLRLLGIELRVRKSRKSVAVELCRRESARGAEQSPPIFDDPLEAIYRERGGKRAAFHCPIDRCVHINGLNFSAGGWHPFSALLEGIGTGADASYEGSILERYYQVWRPRNAREALIGVGPASTTLNE